MRGQLNEAQAERKPLTPARLILSLVAGVISFGLFLPTLTSFITGLTDADGSRMFQSHRLPASYQDLGQKDLPANQDAGRLVSEMISIDAKSRSGSPAPAGSLEALAQRGAKMPNADLLGVIARHEKEPLTLGAVSMALSGLSRSVRYDKNLPESARVESLKAVRVWMTRLAQTGHPEATDAYCRALEWIAGDVAYLSSAANPSLPVRREAQALVEACRTPLAWQQAIRAVPFAILRGMSSRGSSFSSSYVRQFVQVPAKIDRAFSRVNQDVPNLALWVDEQVRTVPPAGSVEINPVTWDHRFAVVLDNEMARRILLAQIEAAQPVFAEFVRTGRFPTRLPEETLPADPYQPGSRMQFRGTENQFILWSRGPDLYDDGGSQQSTRPFSPNRRMWLIGGDIRLEFVLPAPRER